MDASLLGFILAALFAGVGVSQDHGHDHGSGSGRGAHESQEKATAPPLLVPLKGVMANCCNQAIEKALRDVKAVHSVKVQKTGEQYVAEVILKTGEGLPLSELKGALEAANRAMGDSMGTKYEVDESLSSSAAHFYRTASEVDGAELKKALHSLKGYQGVCVKKSGFSAFFSGDKVPSVDEVSQASGLEIREVILAPLAHGKRFACPMHPEKVSHSGKHKCPVCGMLLVEVVHR